MPKRLNLLKFLAALLELVPRLKFQRLILSFRNRGSITVSAPRGQEMRCTSEPRPYFFAFFPKPLSYCPFLV